MTYAHIQYIIASLFHWNIKVYIFITILERKDQVKKTIRRLSCSSFSHCHKKQRKKDREKRIERKTEREKERFGVKNRKATVTGCHRFCARIRKGGKQPYMLSHILYMHTHMFISNLWSPFTHYIPQTLCFTLHLTKEHQKHQIHVDIFLDWF